tara:strand:- start:255 stop:455 length:201 start_codon:yes stop_codon:yes gene_type:complete
MKKPLPKANRMMDLIQTLEYDLTLLYHTGEIVEWLEKDIEYVEMTLTAVIMDKQHFLALGMIIGEA